MSHPDNPLQVDDHLHDYIDEVLGLNMGNSLDVVLVAGIAGRLMEECGLGEPRADVWRAFMLGMRASEELPPGDDGHLGLVVGATQNFIDALIREQQ